MVVLIIGTEGGKTLKYNFPLDLLFSALIILDIGHNEVRGFLPTGCCGLLT